MSYSVWVDSQNAFLMKMDGTGGNVTHLKTHGHKHHKEPQGRHGVEHHPESLPLFKDLHAALKSADKVLVMGPGEAKHRFVKFVKEHDKHLAEKIIGVENADQVSEGEFKKATAEFYKKYNVFGDQ